jgi:hypothetical protein
MSQITEHVWLVRENNKTDFKYCQYCRQCKFPGMDESKLQPCFKRFNNNKFYLWLKERNWENIRTETETKTKATYNYINLVTGQTEGEKRLKSKFIKEMDKIQKGKEMEIKIQSKLNSNELQK